MMLHNILIRRILHTAIEKRARKYITGKVIDIGCGEKQYKDLLSQFVTEHIGVDHYETVHNKESIDIFGEAYDIPVKASSFDSALLTEVLEHLEEPAKALRECSRVLRPGGTAIITTPFIWHLHEEPRDFFRYSEHGLRYLFEINGFDVVEITPLCGFWVTFGQLFVYYLYTYNRGPIRYLYIIPLMGLFIQFFAWLLNILSPSPRWTSHHIAVVKKSTIAT